VALVLFGGVIGCGRLRWDDGTMRSDDAQCRVRFARLLTPALAQRFDVVAVSPSNRTFSRVGLPFLEATRRLRELNPRLKVLTFGSYLKTRVPCARLINATGSSLACARPGNLEYFEADPATEPFFEDFMAITDHYIDRVDLLCDGRRAQRCLTQTPEGTPALYDKHHHSLEFARYSGRLYARRYPDPVRSVLD
jgi:hypothetical protein